MSAPFPTARQFDEGAFACAVVLVAVLLCLIVDGHDGVTWFGRSRIVRLADDPVAFRGALIARWGLWAIMAALGMIALGIGALVARGVEKASSDE